MKNIRKMIALVCAAASVSTVTASAAWEFAGYDTTNPPQYMKIYNEVIDGNYTCKTKEEPVAPWDVQWVLEGYELAYPHAGYERLYLEGNAQKAITRTVSLFPQWDVRFRDFMWEVAGDHQIYQRQQTKINNTYWAWDFGRNAAEESLVFVPTTRTAKVEETFRTYAIGNLDEEGNLVYSIEDGILSIYDDEVYTTASDYNALPAEFDVYYDEFGYPTSKLKVNDPSISEEARQAMANYDISADNLYDKTDYEVAQIMKNYIAVSKVVTGPSYYGESGTKDVAPMYYANRNAGWAWDYDTVRGAEIEYLWSDGLYDYYTEDEVKIEWSKPLYEMAEPYLYYEYLIVNGVAMDGSKGTPEIWRYTGGKAIPDVEWRYAFTEADWPHRIVEFKYIRDNDGDMVLAFDRDGVVEFRYPTGDFGSCYIKVTDTMVQCWVKSDVGEELLYEVPRAGFDFGSGFAGYVNAAGYIVSDVPYAVGGVDYSAADVG